LLSVYPSSKNLIKKTLPNYIYGFSFFTLHYFPSRINTPATSAMIPKIIPGRINPKTEAIPVSIKYTARSINPIFLIKLTLITHLSKKTSTSQFKYIPITIEDEKFIAKVTKYLLLSTSKLHENIEVITRKWQECR
jgi:hypothetical protein